MYLAKKRLKVSFNRLRGPASLRFSQNQTKGVWLNHVMTLHVKKREPSDRFSGEPMARLSAYSVNSPLEMVIKRTFVGDNNYGTPSNLFLILTRPFANLFYPKLKFFKCWNSKFNKYVLSFLSFEFEIENEATHPMGRWKKINLQDSKTIFQPIKGQKKSKWFLSLSKLA